MASVKITTSRARRPAPQHPLPQARGAQGQAGRPARGQQVRQRAVSGPRPRAGPQSEYFYVGPSTAPEASHHISDSPPGRFQPGLRRGVGRRGRPPPRATRRLPLRGHCSAWPLASNTRAPEPLPPGWRHPCRTRFCGNRAPCSLRLFAPRPPGCGLGAPGRVGTRPHGSAL